MIKQVPHYYKNFKCIASDCKDNCCIGGWQIDIDEETAEYYLSLKGEFGDRLRNSITKTDEYCFKLSDGKCPFLDDENLCEIYKQLGEDKMGVVCTQFPRYSEYFGEIKETGIGLACEEAASIILNDTDDFSIEQLECKEEYVKDKEFDSELANKLFIIRNMLFKAFDNKKYTLSEKLKYLLYICNEVQKHININEYKKIDDLFTCDINSVSDILKSEKNKNNTYLKEQIAKILYPYSDLEVLNDTWEDEINEIFEKIYENDSIDNEMFMNLFYGFKKADAVNEKKYLNILKYFIFRYFMKTSYDHTCFNKALLMVSNLIIIINMNFIKWLDNDKQIIKDHIFDSVHIFSREVEYDEDNIEQLYEEFIFDDIFRYENISNVIDCIF